MTNRNMLAEAGYEKSTLFKNPDYDEAIIGVTDEGQVVYDYYKMVAHLMEAEGMTEGEAVDAIDYSMARLLPDKNENLPIIMYGLNDIV